MLPFFNKFFLIWSSCLCIRFAEANFINLEDEWQIIIMYLLYINSKLNIWYLKMVKFVLFPFLLPQITLIFLTSLCTKNQDLADFFCNAMKNFSRLLQALVEYLCDYTCAIIFLDFYYSFNKFKYNRKDYGWNVLDYLSYLHQHSFFRLLLFI